MKLKRDHTFGAHKVVPAKQTSNLSRGSRFVQCPLCGANLAWHTINAHLDTAHAFVSDSTCSRPASGRSGGPDCTQTSGSDPVRGNNQPQSPQQDNTTTGSESQANRKQQQPWWQAGRPSKESLASAKLTTNTRQATPLMDDELRSLTPCEVVRDALPAKLANTLLKGLISDAATWTRGTWYMGGKEHIAPRTSSYYTFPDTEEATSVCAFDDDAKDVSSSVETQMAAPELKEAASIVSDHVNRLAGRIQSSLASSDRHDWHCSYALCNMYQDGQEGVGPHADRLTTLGPRPIIASLSLGATRIFRIKCMTPQADATTKPETTLSGWQQSVQLPVSGPPHAAQGAVVIADGPSCNARPSAESSWQHLLQTGRATQRQEFVGMQDAAARMKASQHCMPEGMQSDACKGQQAALHGGDGAAPQQKQENSPKPGIRSVCSADVQLPHNTLVIMWPPMQEAWKHEVPKCKHVASHPIAGKARINLTFRRLKPEWAEKAPCCRCNQQAVLKASLSSSATSQQRYYFACDNTKGPGCGFFSWAQIAAI
ncbi:hypothetical protein WJX77_008979 [Trebouxia sp. C0004]